MEFPSPTFEMEVTFLITTHTFVYCMTVKTPTSTYYSIGLGVGLHLYFTTMFLPAHYVLHSIEDSHYIGRIVTACLKNSSNRGRHRPFQVPKVTLKQQWYEYKYSTRVHTVGGPLGKFKVTILCTSSNSYCCSCRSVMSGGIP